MRRTQYANTAGAPYACLILPVCALVVLSGCGWFRGSEQIKTKPVNSPITVADGSMIVRTKATSQFDPKANTLTVSGGKACSISVGTGTPIPLGTSWRITSSDNQATISTTDGINIVVAVAVAASLNDDGTSGKGAEFGKAAIQFSPATLDNPSNTLDCSQTCRINYWVPAAETNCN
jgi:hypothetical protein